MPEPEPISPDHEALSDILVAHQRIPTFDGSLSSKRCSGLGCDSMKGQSDGPNSPRHAWHLADLIIEEGWVSAETLKAREAAARREALLEAAEDLFTLCERRDEDPLMHDRETAGIEIAGHRLRALAEPERDEEGGNG